MQQLTRDVPAQFRQTVLPFLAESVLILSRTRAVEQGRVPELIEISRCCATHALSLAESSIRDAPGGPAGADADAASYVAQLRELCLHWPPSASAPRRATARRARGGGGGARDGDDAMDGGSSG